MPKAKPGQSRKGKNKAPKTTTQRGQSSTGLSADDEQASIDKIANLDLVHDTDNEAEMDVEFITDGSYSNWEKPTNTGEISTLISALIDDK
jgi:hypothetical protein